jgi:hypothetical protein
VDLPVNTCYTSRSPPFQLCVLLDHHSASSFLPTGELPPSPPRQPPSACTHVARLFPRRGAGGTAMQKWRIVILRFGTARQKVVLE